MPSQAYTQLFNETYSLLEKQAKFSFRSSFLGPTQDEAQKLYNMARRRSEFKGMKDHQQVVDTILKNRPILKRIGTSIRGFDDPKKILADHLSHVSKKKPTAKNPFSQSGSGPVSLGLAAAGGAGLLGAGLYGHKKFRERAQETPAEESFSLTPEEELLLQQYYGLTSGPQNQSFYPSMRFNPYAPR